MSIQYRVRHVERFIVTRHETFEPAAGSINTKQSQTRQIGGEHDNADVAYEVAYALARKEQEDLGLMPGDMGVIFPQHPREAKAVVAGDSVNAAEKWRVQMKIADGFLYLRRWDGSAFEYAVYVGGPDDVVEWVKHPPYKEISPEKALVSVTGGLVSTAACK